MLAVVVGRPLKRLVVPPQKRAGPAAVRHERRGLVVVLPHVELQGTQRHGPLGPVLGRRRLGARFLTDAPLAQAGRRPHLHDLSLHQMLDHRREQLHGLQVAEAGQRDGGPRQQEVAGQDGHLVAEHPIDRRRASPRVRLVDHVVMEQRRRVDHLCNLRQPPLSIADLAAAAGRRHQQHHRGPDFLAAIQREEVLRARLQHRVVRPQEMLDALAQRHDVALHQAEGIRG
mmetsp:Transcript_8830/g.33338  ORF Transcript_8830/g.33338 Transcript_8830/m.33338 type:complete len:229 (-) Transcript_8830:217-903(-)